ncbi:MAG: response regulator transcription factor [Akkermansiaceae bacterium]|jgi:DNA-binding NarL/FixJ family response regulator|nr:response regulator transcription factor [Akkermansiaceae bacterium]
MTPPANVRILLADDHSVVRMGLAALITTEPGLSVVGHAADGEEAVLQYRTLRPDVVVMDLLMPKKSGSQATAEIRAAFPAARILILSTSDGDDDVYRALQSGAAGYILKSSPGEQLIPAIHAVMRGEKWIPAEVARSLANRSLREELSPREVQVLRELARGGSNKEIAAVLNITEHTVKAHLKNILAKLPARDRTEAVTLALQRGIIHF